MKIHSFHEDCKAAKLKPLYKQDAKTNLKKNVASLLLTKIIEEVVHDQVQTCENDNDMLFK